MGVAVVVVVIVEGVEVVSVEDDVVLVPFEGLSVVVLTGLSVVVIVPSFESSLSLSQVSDESGSQD